MAKEELYKRTRNYFFFKLGFPKKAFLRMIKRYKKDHCLEVSHEKVGQIIQQDWNAFMNWWGTVKVDFKDCYFKNKVFGYNKYSRNDWRDIQEALKYTNHSSKDF